MTVKEYFYQAYRLDHRINSDIAEMETLRAMVCSAHSPGFEEHYNPNHPTDAPFVKSLEKVWEFQEKIDDEINGLVNLKKQMRSVIGAVPDIDEQLVLRYRYIHNYTWERIGEELHADRTTVYRWHESALLHVTLPENPIKI